MEPLNLLELRARISRIDTQLIALLAQRFVVAEEIQSLKRALQLPAEDKAREATVLHHVRSLAADFRVDPQLVSSIWIKLFVATRGKLDSSQGDPAAKSRECAHAPDVRQREV